MKILMIVYRVFTGLSFILDFIRKVYLRNGSLPWRSVRLCHILL